MTVLGIETSTEARSVAVVEDGRLKGELFLGGEGRHSARLMEEMDLLLRSLGLPPSRIEGVAVTIGPGSFTGLRVGLSIAKGLAFAAGIPILGIGTLDALRASAPFWTGMICPIIDARNQRVYGALYRVISGQTEQLEREGLRDLRSWIRNFWGPVLFIGDASVKYREVIEDSLGDVARFAPVELCHPRASVVARLGWERLKRRESDDLERLVPLYLQESQAEREVRKRLASGGEEDSGLGGM